MKDTSKNKIHIVYIISQIQKALEFEWVAEYLDKEKFELSFILLNYGSSPLQIFLSEHGFGVHYVSFEASKSGLLKTTLKIYSILRKINADIIHTHLFEANLCGLTAGWLAHIPRRIYTRHHSTLHHAYHPQGIKYDRYCNRMATDIISISPVTTEVLVKKENVSPKKVHEIYHGFDLDKFHRPDSIHVENLRQKYNPQNRSPVFGVIARYTEWKGIQFIIPAFERFLRKFPEALLILANAHGEYKNSIHELLKRLPAGTYREIIFEEDLYSLYQLFDFFIHVPINEHSEAFGQTYVEPLAGGVPSIFTLSGIATSFIKNGINARVVPFMDSDSILDAMNDTMVNHDLNQRLILQGWNDVQVFKIENMISALEKLYSETAIKK